MADPAGNRIAEAFKRSAQKHGTAGFSEEQRKVVNDLFTLARQRFASEVSQTDLSNVSELEARILDVMVSDPTVLYDTERIALDGYIEMDAGSEAIWEVGPEGKRSPARKEIQEWFAAHDELDRLAHAAGVPRFLPPEKLAVREELRQVLQREAIWQSRQPESGRVGPPGDSKTRAASKYNRRLLCGQDENLKDNVTLKKAQQYLRIGERRRQKLVADGTLIVVGTGQKKRISVQSLLAYAGDTDEIPN